MAVEKRNIFLTQTVETMPYTSTSKPIGTNYPKRTVATHAAFIEKITRVLFQIIVTEAGCGNSL